MKFVRKLVARSAHAAALGAASLNHELRNYAMEDQTVVERPFFLLVGLFIREFFRAFGKPDEICNGLRRFFFQQAHHNVSLGSFKNSVSPCCPAHAISFCAGSSYTSQSFVRHCASSIPRWVRCHFSRFHHPFCLRSSVMCAV